MEKKLLKLKFIFFSIFFFPGVYITLIQITHPPTRSTQREQNAQLLVTSLSSDIKYCTEDNKIKPNM